MNPDEQQTPASELSGAQPEITPAQEADEGFEAQRENHPDNPDGTFDNLDAVIPPHTPDSLAVVGMGGSAGGIPALRKFFSLMPPDSGIAFVVVLHLAPDHESALSEVLQTSTLMPVVTVNEVVQLEANHVYVIPPNVHLGLSDGKILPEPLHQPRGKRVVVDLFFRALADTYGTKAVGIVLSGADGDGAIGLKRIKERGGLTVAQDPAQAEHDSMPRAAIATGMVDWILPVEQMAARLLTHQENEKALRLPPEVTRSHKNQEQKSVKEAPKEAPHDDETALREVLSLLQMRTGHDFSSYKRATVLRRIGRRLQVNSLPDLPRYLDFLRTVPAEAGALLGDLLINVTNFFRDTEAFDALKKIIPGLFTDKKSGDQVRVWVAGCATGEEAYSIAMLLHEYAANMDNPPKIVVFATDISEEAIMRAREGCYPETIQADVSPERLRRFFTIDANCYRVKKEIRESVLFATHNLLKDAPFSRLDLITCRNLLIYLGRDAQQRAFETFHFALRPDGILFLGTSESADDAGRLFASLDKKYRLYIRRAPARSATPPFPLPTLRPVAPVLPMSTGLVARYPGGGMAASQTNGGTPAEISRRGTTFGELHLRLLERYAPPSVLVGDDYEILHLSESAGHYLQFAGGEPSNNLLKVVHPSLRLELSTALFSAGQTGKDVQVADVPLQAEDGTTKHITLNVRPVPASKPNDRTLMLVLFEESGEVAVRPALPVNDPIARRLDAEVQHLKAQLRATVEQYEASGEELKASNEELEAMNEEARSTTEELETSKEELQSLNEELITVNQELKSNVEELGRSNSDLQNLMTSTDIPTIFLDRDLRIKRYTPRAMEIFNIIPSDINRPLAHLTHMLEYPELVADAESVLDNLAAVEREISMANEQWFLSHMRPYRNSNNHIDGVVLTLVGITSRRQSEEALRESEERYRTLFESVDEGFSVIEMIYDENGRAIDYCMLETNPAFERLTGYENPKGKTARELNPNLEEYWIETFATVAQTGKSIRFENYVATVDSWFDVSAARAGNPKDRRVVTVFSNTTQRKRAEEAVRESEERFRLLVEGTKDYAMFLMDGDRRIVHWNTGAERIFGFSREEAIGCSGDMIFTPEDLAAGEHLKEMKTAEVEGRAIDRRWHVRKDGSRFWADGVMTSLNQGGSTLHGFAKVARDATAERQAAEALQLAHERLQLAHDELELRVAERTAQFRELNEELQLEVVRRQELEQARELLLKRIVTTQEEERRRISRELHDQTGQQLTALLMGLKTLPDKLGTAAPPADTPQESTSRVITLAALSAHLQPLQKVTEDLMEQVHKLAWELRPAALDNLGLEAALKLHAQEWAKHSGIEPDFISRGFTRIKRLPPPVETTLYRVVQEALTNVQRHAQAQHVSILLERVGDEVIAVIEDDGQGFSLAGKRKPRASAKSVKTPDDVSPVVGAPNKISGRLGLLGMRERIELIGGTLAIESKPGKGTSVYVRVPVERRKAARNGNGGSDSPA